MTAPIELYYWPTPNGWKISIALEEMGLPYAVHLVNIGKGEQFAPDFLKIAPNNRMPAIIDPEGPDGAPISIFESGAILQYLARKTGQFGGPTERDRIAVDQWLMWQMGGVGPMFGQYGFFHAFAGKEIEDPRPRKRYADEAKRLLGVMERQLEGRDWIAGDYSIADIALAPWLWAARKFYKMDADPAVDWASLKNVPAYLDRFLARPAVQRGLAQPPR